MSTLYETDFYGWTQQTAEKLRQGRLDEIDLTALAEEVRSLGASEERELQRRFELYLMHRLKWDYQPERRTRSWTLTIKEQHRQAIRLVQKNPSLKPLARELFTDAYLTARALASSEAGLEECEIPEESTLLFDDCFPELV